MYGRNWVSPPSGRWVPQERQWLWTWVAPVK